MWTISHSSHLPWQVGLQLHSLIDDWSPNYTTAAKCGGSYVKKNPNMIWLECIFSAGNDLSAHTLKVKLEWCHHVWQWESDHRLTSWKIWAFDAGNLVVMQLNLFWAHGKKAAVLWWFHQQRLINTWYPITGRGNRVNCMDSLPWLHRDPSSLLRPETASWTVSKLTGWLAGVRSAVF